MRQCKSCDKSKSLNEFPAQTKNGKIYFAYTCKKCWTARKAQRRKSDPDKRHLKWRANRVQKLRGIIIQAKNQPCSACGRSFHHCAMDLDHRNPEKKKFTISDYRRLSLSERSLRDEIAKCDVLCAVCHRLRTYERNHQPIKKIDRVPLRSHRNRFKKQKIKSEMPTIEA